jgi:hypothetical protein
MQYKTIILQYIRQRPTIHNQLKSDRTLLPTLDLWANELKRNHEAWKEQLSQANPGKDPGQVVSQALEIALQEWINSLPPETPKDEPLSLDGAMAYILRHTPAE